MVNHKYQPIREIGTETLPIHSSTTTKKRRIIGIQYFTNLFIFASGLAIGYFLSNKLQGYVAASKHLVPSPANEAIDGKPLILSPHNEGDHHHNPFTGFPTPEKNAAWMELMDGYAIRVPAGPIKALGLESISLNDGSGDVWVSMNIYHHLHCLDSIRHQIAGEGCKPPDHEVSNDYFPPHIDHCLETLRKRLICQPDLGIRAVAWHPEIGVDAVKANNTVNAECVDWSAIQEWTRQHTFSPDDQLITQPNGKIYNGPWTPPPRCGV